MEELELNFDADEFNKLLENDCSIEDFLLTIFSDQDTGSFKAICDKLLRYYSIDGGDPHIETLSLGNVKYERIAKTGSICFQFKVNFWFVCSGLERVQSGHETVNFTVNEEHSALTLMFPLVEERSTHEEF